MNVVETNPARSTALKHKRWLNYTIKIKNTTWGVKKSKSLRGKPI